MTVRKLVNKAVAGTAGTYVGRRGEIFYNPDHGALSISDGTTVGGNPIHIHAESVIYDHNIVPETDNTYTLGNSTYRWKELFIGPGTLYITDAVLNIPVALSVSNGVLQIDGANQLQVGQLKFVDNTIQSTTSNINIEMGQTADTADLVFRRNTVVGNTKSFTASGNITANGVATFNGNVAITDAKTFTVGGTATFNGNVAVAAGKTLKVGGNSVVTTSTREFEPAFIDAAGAFRGATARGVYTLHNDLCYFRINIDFATCTNFGSGQYQVTLPFKSIATMTQRSGTLHQTTGDVKYHIAGIVDLESHTANPGDTMFLYYSGGATDLAWEVGRPAGATTVTSHFDISGWYQIA